ncbi:MAG: hypothetical protein J7L44_04305 [Candidatus Diapherotrites archaeon]|nr:hypothetical protein [Candidatus Diapherotrites archaeon]
MGSKCFQVFIVAIAFLFLNSALADCLWEGKQIKDNETVTIDCIMLHGESLEYVENSGMLICKGTELYFANELTTKGTPVNRVFTCDCEQAYGWHHPWHFVTAVAGAKYTKTSVCRGSTIEVTLPKQFSVVCIDGSIKTGYPSFFVGTRDGSKIEVLGHNCSSFSSSGCNTRFEAGATAKVIIPFVSLEQKTLDVFAAMQTKYDYHITEEHLPFGVVERGYQTLTLIDPAFTLSIDKPYYCPGESIKISGTSVCCGEAGKDVSISIKDSSGNVVIATNAKITSDNKYEATIPLDSLSPGNYTVEAVAPLASKFSICKKNAVFSIKSRNLILGTDKAVLPAGSALKVLGYEQCCAAPNEKVKITVSKNGNILVSTEAEIASDGRFAKLVMLPPGETGAMEIGASFSSMEPECVKKVSVTAVFPDKLKGLIAENIKEGEKAHIAVECTADLPVVIKIYSYDEGNLVVDSNYICNSGVAEIGPPLEAGVYRVTAEANIPFCTGCRLEGYFTAKGVGGISTPEVHTLLVVLCGFAVLLIVRSKGGIK